MPSISLYFLSGNLTLINLDSFLALLVLLRQILFKVQAITCKNYLLQIYSQHANLLNAI